MNLVFVQASATLDRFVVCVLLLLLLLLLLIAVQGSVQRHIIAHCSMAQCSMVLLVQTVIFNYTKTAIYVGLYQNCFGKIDENCVIACDDGGYLFCGFLKDSSWDSGSSSESLFSCLTTRR